MMCFDKFFITYTVEDQLLYRAHSYLQIDSSGNSWNFIFIVVQHLNVYIKVHAVLTSIKHEVNLSLYFIHTISM